MVQSYQTPLLKVFLCTVLFSCVYCNEILSTNHVPEGYPGNIYTESPQNHWSRDWYRQFHNTLSQLKQRLGFVTINATRGLDTNMQFLSGTEEPFRDYVQAVYPGTLWCGRGNKAKFSENLGKYSDTDFCCREHDNCPDSIRPKYSKYGLRNTGLFTRSHCDCDLQFYSCLKRVNTAVSRQMGITYFNILGPQCFRLDRPVRDCAMVHMNRCILYEYENTDNLQYQWFDLPKF